MSVELDFELDMKGLDRLAQLTRELESKAGYAGFFENRTHPVHGISMAKIAAINNYGGMTPDGRRIPPRPFFSYAVNTAEAPLAAAFRAEFYKLLAKRGTATSALNRVSGIMADWIKTYILMPGIYVDNSEYTKKKKGNKPPLIETGIMAESVEFRVEDD